MFKSNNVTARIFQRQICTPAPSTSICSARRFYENIVPTCTIYDVESPDHSFRKFTEDGLYLISFSRNYQDLIVYRPTWLSFSCKEEGCDSHELPSKARKFEGFFTELYSVALASSGELICKDFFLYTETTQFGLFATSSAESHAVAATGGAVQGVRSVAKITFHLLRMEDGVVLDERVFYNDYINLAHSAGVFLYDDLLAIVSLRYQRIHILQIRESGNLVDVRTIGEFCSEDDELFLYSSVQSMVNPDKTKQGHQIHAANGLHHNEPPAETYFLSGIKQRLLSFVFQGIWNEETDQNMWTLDHAPGFIVLHVFNPNIPILSVAYSLKAILARHENRMQCLKKKFYFHFQDYVDLIIWKVQFLDRHHLLIKLGSVDGVSRNAETHPAFFAVYNMETTEIIAFYQNSTDELYLLFELFCDHFHVSGKNSLYMNYISSHSNNIHNLEQLRSNKKKASSFPQFVKKMLSSLPFTCQSQSPSPYFDQSLFRYDEKLISATDRHRQFTDHPIKFISRRQPNILKFKIKPGPEAGNTDGPAKKISSFLFHPFLPLALSIQQTFSLHPAAAVVNIHFRK